ncbi:CLUMA_CG014769, isoform A [Clunio marinus]|uniref:CLUMA_CG014769, isoform A n=1 Tax=Clunio marinus TaxID=568069 RepID=A0A1J1IMF6_9DIPT|nr:CLUMA_CG014769, isoform A [Clunio marinus]
MFVIVIIIITNNTTHYFTISSKQKELTRIWYLTDIWSVTFIDDDSVSFSDVSFFLAFTSLLEILATIKQRMKSQHLSKAIKT